MARTELEIGGVHIIGTPTNEIGRRELSNIAEFRFEAYCAALTDANLNEDVDQKAVERYVFEGMDVWRDANIGVDRGVLNPHQLFDRTAVWLAKDNNGKLMAEVLSADNASGGGDGRLGEAMRTFKMRVPVFPIVKNIVNFERPVLQHSPYRAVREVIGDTAILEPLMYMTATRETRRGQPMTAYVWDGDNAVSALMSWGFRTKRAVPKNPLGEDGPKVNERVLAARSGKSVTKAIIDSSETLHLQLVAAGL